jgi:DNA-binding response OmpR family regulator
MAERQTGPPPVVLLVGDAVADQRRVERLLDSGAVVVLANSSDAVRPWLPEVSLDQNGIGGALRIGGLEIKLREQRARWEERVLHLTRLEFNVLATLARNPGQAWSFADLQERVWSSPYFGDASHIRSAV